MAKLPKKPKKPKASASFQTWQNYDVRYRNWQSKCTSIKNNKKRKETLIKKYSGK